MSFGELGLSEGVLRAVAESGYEKPTAIQEQAIPLVLEGRDVIGASQTGTGKSAAFALPILSMLPPAGRPQCLVLEPTRELAHQLAESFEHYGKYTGHKVALLHGGIGYGNQISALEPELTSWSRPPGASSIISTVARSDSEP